MKCSHLRLPGVLGLHPTMVDMDMVDVASVPREDLVAVEQLSAELGMRALDFGPRIYPCIYVYTCIFLHIRI